MWTCEDSLYAIIALALGSIQSKHACFHIFMFRRSRGWARIQLILAARTVPLWSYPSRWWDFIFRLIPAKVRPITDIVHKCCWTTSYCRSVPVKLAGFSPLRIWKVDTMCIMSASSIASEFPPCAKSNFLITVIDGKMSPLLHKDLQANHFNYYISSVHSSAIEKEISLPLMPIIGSFIFRYKIVWIVGL